MRFGKLVRRSRQLRGISQGALAKRIGVSQRYVSGIENGEADNPTLKTIQRFASEFTWTDLELLGLLGFRGRLKLSNQPGRSGGNRA